MARYRGPVGKISRRLGIGITEKGQRILSKRAAARGRGKQPQIGRRTGECRVGRVVEFRKQPRGGALEALDRIGEARTGRAEGRVVRRF